MKIVLGWEQERLKLMEEALSERPSSLGEKTFKFEELCSEYWKRRCISCSSGTTALMTAFNFVPSKYRRRGIVIADMMLPLVENVVRKYFKRIRFVDVTPELLQPSFEQWRTALEKPFLSQYGVLFLCHTGGIIIPEIEELIDYAKKKDMFIIEDFSHAHGCTMNGRLAGTYGDISIASMYVTKVLMCGEGGIILVDDEKLERKIQEFVNAGKSRRTEKVKRTGFNFRMSEMNACIGIVDMLHRDEIYAQRKAMADRYVVVPLQEKVPGLQSTYYRFTVLLPKEVDVPLETVSKTFDVNANHALPGTRETVALHRNLALYRGCPPEVVDKNNEVLEQLVQKSILEGRVCRR